MNSDFDDWLAYSKKWEEDFVAVVQFSGNLKKVTVNYR